jgi:predicted nucleic acid-binding protein
MAVDLPVLLVDKSALVRGVDSCEGYELKLCPMTRLEVLYSARDESDHVRIESGLDASYRQVRMNAETFDIAAGAQRELAARSQHRVSIPDLLIAACAQQHGAGVLHVDRHYDVLASVLTFNSVRAAVDG